MTQPVPRLYHCPPGSTIILAGESKPRIVAKIERHHARFADGSFASLCHPVDPDLMQFGDGDGWRIKK